MESPNWNRQKQGNTWTRESGTEEQNEKGNAKILQMPWNGKCHVLGNIMAMKLVMARRY